MDIRPWDWDPVPAGEHQPLAPGPLIFGKFIVELPFAEARKLILVFPVERRFRHEPSFRGPG